MRAFFSIGSLRAGAGDPRILRAQLELVISSLFFTAFINPLGVAMMFGPVLLAPETFGAVPLSHFWIVCGLHALSCIGAWLIYRKRTELFDLARMERRLIWLQLLLGVTWGATIWLLWVQDDPTNNVFATLAMVSMLWAATVTRAAHLRLYLVGFGTMACLYWLRLLTGTTTAAHILTGIFMVWLAYVISIGTAIRRNTLEMLQNRFANEDMAKELGLARDEAQFKRREAEDANRSKTAFLANMSHELRTPLNAILGFSDMIANQILGQGVPPRYRDYAQDINNSGAHLLSLINDLLDVAKIESGHMEINPRILDVPEEIATAKRLIAPKFSAKSQSLSTRLDPDLPSLYADERAFKQIVLNLLSNANKFTPDHGRIAISCSKAPQGGILISVEDNGIGIPPAKLDTIFQPFAQADNRYDRASGGTGLGLALVRGLSELHGGRAWLESVEGEGTRAHVYFPLANTSPNMKRLQA
ncbi:MAG TPA: ATP-binding protein [Rhizomicrobium sp.]|jgi:two-component system cell cycle sensor histidine kinase PleC